jgi:hypothetical protein
MTDEVIQAINREDFVIFGIGIVLLATAFVVTFMAIQKIISMVCGNDTKEY